MATGKAVNLCARPFRSVDLCYPVDGIILSQPDGLLGTMVMPYDVGTIYQRLGESDASGRLLWNSKTIHTTLQSSIVSELRSEPIKSDLDQAICMRQNAFITTYSPTVIDQTQKVYCNNPADQNIVLYKLFEFLQSDTTALHSVLESTYKADGIWGNVVKKTQTDTKFSSASNYPSPGGGTDYQTTAVSNAVSLGYEYRMPSLENDMRYHRALIGQRQEYLAALRMKAMCDNGSVTFGNELNAFDQQIRKLQSAYIDTMLVPPFSGLITGVFRNAGDFVQAGQPVIRLENDTDVYLVGTIKYRGPLRAGGNKATVTTTLWDVPGSSPIKLQGSVAAVRGHDSVDEQYDVLIRCSNRNTAGAPIVPVNYNFDFESTSIDIT